MRAEGGAMRSVRHPIMLARTLMGIRLLHRHKLRGRQAAHSSNSFYYSAKCMLRAMLPIRCEAQQGTPRTAHCNMPPTCFPRVYHSKMRKNTGAYYASLPCAGKNIA